MREIRLTRGLVAFVDDEDYEALNQYCWHASNAKRPYAVRWTPNGAVYMHREILGVPPGTHGDHINGESLDNRRANLRAATSSQNCANRRLAAGRLKGVYPHRRRWIARIKVGNYLLYLGMHATAEDAARAYDTAAKIHHGEFAVLNFPEAA